MYILFLRFNPRLCVIAMAIYAVLGIITWVLYRKIGWHRSFIWFNVLFLTSVAVFSVMYDGQDFLQYLYLACMVLEFLVLIPYVTLNVIALPFDDQYTEYLNAKIDQITPPDDEHLFKYKERAGYDRQAWNFYDMNDIQRELSLDEWRKEMRFRLFNPIECLRVCRRRRE